MNLQGEMIKHRKKERKKERKCMVSCGQYKIFVGFLNLVLDSVFIRVVTGKTSSRQTFKYLLCAYYNLTIIKYCSNSSYKHLPVCIAILTVNNCIFGV